MPKSKSLKTRAKKKSIKPSTKYKTGKSKDYEGACQQDQVKICVKQEKYCNVDTGKCIAPKAVKTKVNKDSTLAVDPSYGVVGKAQAVNNIKKYLKQLSKVQQKKLDIGVVTKIVEQPVTKTATKKASKKSSAKTKAKKECTAEECAKEGKLCNPDTGNCVQDTAANRKKLGVVSAPPATKKVQAPKPKPKAKAVNYDNWTVVMIKEELGKRGLSKTGNKKILAQRLKDDDKGSAKPAAKKSQVSAGGASKYAAMTVAMLKQELESRQLSKSGRKADLVKRLQEDDKAVPAEEESPEEIAIEAEESPEEEEIVIEAEEESPEESPEVSPEESEEIAIEAEEVSPELSEEIAIEAEEESPEESEELNPTIKAMILKKAAAAKEKAKDIVEDIAEEISEVSEDVSEALEAENCRKDGCDEGMLCNVDTGKCMNQDVEFDSDHYMLKYNNGVYYGSVNALEGFAKSMGIKNPKIQAAKQAAQKELVKKKAAEKKELDIEEIISAPEDLESVSKIIQDVSSEESLTKAQQELVKKIRDCLGI